MYEHHNPLMQTLGSRSFLTGVGVGAVVTMLVCSPAVQRALFRTVAKATNALTSGLAEAKERFHEAQAEVYHEAAQEADAS